MKQDIHKWQEAVKNLREDALSVDETRRMLANPSPIVRVQAMYSLVRRSNQVVDIVNVLVDTARDDSNRNTKLIGVATVSQEAIHSLYELGTKEALSALMDMWKELSETERFYLQTRFVDLNDWVSKHTIV